MYEAFDVSDSDPVGYQEPSSCISDRDEAESDLLPCLRVQGLFFLSRGNHVLLEADACVLGLDNPSFLDWKYDHV